ncbi:N-6 DNA methylase [Actinoallomurus spadix]|uniref:site-specific DNA-methyltransferase (adenine-specific) n=1 Tax=Actinoallomurus spadix TaxID=79912 RepID=A0ABN0XJP3_9ACTN|nr:DNA methyltransferase [Actinoallomurus spadix]MCO5984955.1 N-6 DNA methylase [Actinoallomurus spadix]
MTRTSTLPVGVASVGGLLPEETLRRLSTGNSLSGTAPAAYHLGKDETVVDAAERAWTYLRGRYASFKDQLAKLPEDDPAIGVTREYWLGRLCQELGFGRLPHTPAGGLTSDDGEKQFVISHQWQHVPIHQLGWGVALDKRTKGVPGAADAAPQSLVQEYLNRSDAALWGIVTNGRLLRVLRDSSALAGSAYVEFDLEAIFEGEAFDAFILLYRVTHVSRFETQGEDTGPASCWLEKWRQEAIDSGVRVLEELRKTVKAAIETLGTGFIQHPDNEELRRALEDRHNDEVTPETLHRALLRTVYRLLFLFVAEDREVLLDPAASQEARDRYATYFSTERLRRLAARRHGGRHSDEWQALTLILDGLGQEGGRPELGLPALGGIFELTGADTALHGCSLANEHLFTAVRSLSRVRDEKARRIRRVDFRHLGSEELGSVYEWLLSYVPKYDPAERTFNLRELGGNERKTSGSYYTPSSLIDVLLDSALEPVIDDAVKSGRTVEEQERALLALTVCDPACGSGHFLVAAARRIAKRLAFVRTGDPEPSNEEVRRALREVVSRCIYGVDINPMAIELAKVSLWLEALEPGKPLGFLDAHLKVGNALLGTTPKLLAGGLPDDAFKPIEGDDKKWVAALKKRNKAEREAYENRHLGVQGELFSETGLRVGNNGLARQALAIADAQDDDLSIVHAKAGAYRKLRTSPEYLVAKELADAWCAAFPWSKTRDSAPAITTQTLLDLREESDRVEVLTRAGIRDLAEQYRFFHWHLEFPEVFSVPDDGALGIDESSGWSGGFKCVLGNPPWERIKLQEKEFFATRNEEISTTSNKAARSRLIEQLRIADSDLYGAFLRARRKAESESHFLRGSGRYPLAGRGDINTYAIFAELGNSVVSSDGLTGMILPAGICTDATTAPFFDDLVTGHRLIHVYGFRNNRGLFKGVGHGDVRFCLLAWRGMAGDASEIHFGFDLGIPDEIKYGDHTYRLASNVIALVNPNTGSCPTFKGSRDAEIISSVYRRVPILWHDSSKANPWQVSFLPMFHMAGDSVLFKTGDDLSMDGWHLEGNVFCKGGSRMLPLYEGKMAYHYDHRFGDYRNRAAGRQDSVLPRVAVRDKRSSDYLVAPRYWVAEKEVDGRMRGLDKGWFVGWRDICRSSDERTMISTILPRAAVGHTMPLMLGENTHLLVACLSSFVVDYIARQKIGGMHMTYSYLKQLPILGPESYECAAWWDKTTELSVWITRRVLELSYTATDLRAFAEDVGDLGPPFVWDEERRLAMRAELDVAYFLLYGITRDDVAYILDSFPLVRKKDVVEFGSYRTKELILEVYDAMTSAIRTGKPYRSFLNPLPGEGPRHRSVPVPAEP